MNIIAENVLYILLVAVLVFYLIFTKHQNVKFEKEIQKKRATLGETKKQVKLMHSYHADYIVLENLLKEGTITAELIEKTDKVILRFEIIDDEGSSFIKTLEFDANRIIYDIEIS